MSDELAPKKLALIRILQILEQESSPEHPLTQEDILTLLESRYGIELERKAVGRTISMLQKMFEEDAKNQPASAEIILLSDKHKGSYFAKRLFEDEELRLLIDSVISSKYIAERYSTDLIEKLCLLSNKYFRSQVKYIDSIQEWDKTENKLLFYNIMTISDAIEKECKIQFDFNKYGPDKKLHKTSTQIASPYQMIIHNQKYYLMFLSEKWQNISYFRLDRINNIKLLEDQHITEITTLKGYSKGINYKKIASSMPYLFSDQIEVITFLAEESAIDSVIDWFGKDINIKKTSDNKYLITIQSSPNAMEYWAMQYLNSVEILTPISLREKIKQNINDAKKKYE